MRKFNLLLAILIIGLAGAFFASAFPDGLEWSAEIVGVEVEEGAGLEIGIIPDYEFTSLSSELSGLMVVLIGLGMMVVFGLIMGLIVFRYKQN